MNKHLLILLIFLLSACSDERRSEARKQDVISKDDTTYRQDVEAASNDDEFLEFLGIEKKYDPEDCIIKVDFDWGAMEDDKQREFIIQNMMPQMGLAINDIAKKRYDSPLFLDRHNYWEGYHIFNFLDRCEDREMLARQLIQDYWASVFDDFPAFTLDTEVESGFSATQSFEIQSDPGFKQ